MQYATITISSTVYQWPIDSRTLSMGSETARAQFLKGNETSPILIPEREPHAAEALQQRHTVHAVKFGMVVECLWQAVIRNAAAQVVHMMHADVCCEPAQDSRQVVV